jgi:hypothetical protein
VVTECYLEVRRGTFGVADILPEYQEAGEGAQRDAMFCPINVFLKFDFQNLLVLLGNVSLYVEFSPYGERFNLLENALDRAQFHC